jgi:hypothetical protein
MKNFNGNVIQKALEKGPIHTELREQVHVTSNQNNIIPFVTTYSYSKVVRIKYVQGIQEQE